MRALALRGLFVVGMLVGAALAPFIFLVALVTGRRPIHFDGVLLRAELEPLVDDTQLVGAAIVRLSGGRRRENATGADVLGFALRLQLTASDELTRGDQDLIFGTFESFLSLPRTTPSVVVADSLANPYSSVAPWRVPGRGAVTLRLVPPRTTAAPAGADRTTRLAADLAGGTATLTLTADGTPLARVRLLHVLDLDAGALRMSMWRTGRGVHPTGARNGIRAVVYPVSQVARRLRHR